MRHWTRPASRAFDYLTRPSRLPRVVRVDRTAPDADGVGERVSDRVLRIIESEGWDAHADATLIDFLATLNVEGQAPEKLQGLIAEMLHFCYSLDADESESGDA
ncbi:MAG: hypothetical protein ABGY41_14490 [Candidatus Poribacteria bacterium]